jgi:hypothetical protein
MRYINVQVYVLESGKLVNRSSLDIQFFLAIQNDGW